MIEIIAHNLAPIMFTSVMALLLLGYPVAFTLAAGGLVFFFIGVELSIVAPNEIQLLPNLVEASPVRAFDISMRSDTAFSLTGVFLVWFAMSNVRSQTAVRPGLAELARDHGLAILAVALFGIAPVLLPYGPAELTAAFAAVALGMHAFGKTPCRRPLHEVLEMTARATASAMLILIALRVAGLTFYGIEGHNWLDSLGLPGMFGITLGVLVSVTLILLMPIRAVTHGQAIRSGAAA